MKPEPLCGIFAKTERAKAQIDDLNARIRAFFRPRPYEMVFDINEKDEQVWSFRLTTKISIELSVVIGEILHNLRSPLDQMLCAVALQHGLSEDYVQFPSGVSIDKFKARLKDQKKLGIPTDALAIVEAAKPYKGGNDLLHALMELNRRDKHRVGIVPINLPAQMSFSQIVFMEGIPLVVGPRTGQHLLQSKPRPTREELAALKKPTAIFDARPGRIHFTEFGPLGDKGMEFMTTTPGAQFYADFQPALDIAFDDVGLNGQPVVAALNQMRDLIEGILLAFEKRFFI